MLSLIPLALGIARKRWSEYCFPRSESKISPGWSCRRDRAICRASISAVARRWSVTPCPTIRREHMSSTVVRYDHPCTCPRSRISLPGFREECQVFLKISRSSFACSGSRRSRPSYSSCGLNFPFPENACDPSSVSCRIHRFSTFGFIPSRRAASDALRPPLTTGFTASILNCRSYYLRCFSVSISSPFLLTLLAFLLVYKTGSTPHDKFWRWEWDFIFTRDRIRNWSFSLFLIFVEQL